MRSVTIYLIGIVILILMCVGVYLLDYTILTTPKPEREPKRVILITPDTLRYDRVTPELMPNVCEWANDATQYKYALSTSDWTSPSFAAMMTGEYPKDVKHYDPPPVDHVDWIANGTPTIARVLHDQGFQTVAFVSSTTVGMTGGFAQGFDEFYRRDSSETKFPSSAAIFSDAMDWLDAHPDEDVFMWLHTWDCHFPYNPPKPDRRRMPDIEGRWDYEWDPWLATVRTGELTFTDAEMERGEELYNQGVSAYDRRLGRFLKWQEENYPAMVVFVSDHGEEFWEHGGFEHGHTMYDELLHVPLIVKEPGGKAAFVANSISTRQVYDLVLDPNLTWEGRLVYIPLFHDHNIFGDPLYAVTYGGFRYILNRKTGAGELYDYINDPGMQIDLADSMPEKCAELKARIEAWSAGTPLPPPSEEMLEQLKSIGYLGG